jgi:hypothetical protein
MAINRKGVLRGFVAVVALLLAGGSVTAQTTAVVVFDAGSPSIRFAAGDVQAALRGKGFTVLTAAPDRLSSQTATVQVVITTTEASLSGQPSVDGLTAQGYAIRRVTTGGTSRWWAIGSDVPGAMYGGLELAEAVQIAGTLTGVGDRQVNPHIARRGIKFNIPLDARTPSYSDDSSSAQANIADMWSMDFWKAFLDEMARHRYNLLSLWNLSPFPSLVKVPEYPNVALADVKRKSGALWDATLQGRKMYDSTWPLDSVKAMTIDEKIAFWRSVMEYARDRGVDVALFTWNTFVYGTEGSGYGISDSLDNTTTRDYVRKSVRALFNTYPLLTAIGITSGENMGDESSGTLVSTGDKERWLWETYGLGVQDAMADAKDAAGPHYRPGRVIRLIHRAHQSNLSDIVSLFRQLPGYDAADSTLSFSFKYSQAHMHSSTTPLFIHQNGWFNTIPPGKKTWLTIRNDDMYYMRWGDPDFVRTYLTSLPDMAKIAGFYMGPDGYTWGRELLSTEPDTPRQMVIGKMWYSFLLWGRLAYEPSLPNSHFQRILGARFPEASASDLFTGWASVSKILPLMTRFYWGSLDFMWYPEACWSNTGFHTVQNMINPKYAPMNAEEDGQSPRLMSVKAYVDGEAPGGRLTPLEVADMLARHADEGLQRVERLAPGTNPGTKPGTNKELRLTLGDIRAMAWLGRYYAEKIRGAVDLYRYEKGGNSRDHQNARVHLQTASSHWRQYAALWSAQYVGQVLTRMGPTPVDIRAIQTFVDRDIPAPLAGR